MSKKNISLEYANNLVYDLQKAYWVERGKGARFLTTTVGREYFTNKFLPLIKSADIDDILTIRKDGSFQVTKIEEKVFAGKDIIHIAVFKKNDARTIYNLVYRDGKSGYAMMKRCAITGITRDKEYNLTKST